MNNKLISSTKDLYIDIDSCISEIIRARLDHDTEAEGKALFKMESLMVGAMQQLGCVIDYLESE